MRATATVLATILSLSATVSGLSLPRQATFETLFCQGEKGPLRSNNFCQAAGGAVLPSVGFCCIGTNDIEKQQALAKGCTDNGAVLTRQKVPCSP